MTPYIGSPRRFLDIGSAYGGFLRAWRERGAAVVGVEIEPGLVGLARANVAGGAGEVLQADILACDPATLGAFDLHRVQRRHRACRGRSLARRTRAGPARTTLSPEVAQAVTDRYWTYAATLFNALERARKGFERPAFESRYLAPFWTFVVRRR